MKHTNHSIRFLLLCVICMLSAGTAGCRQTTQPASSTVKSPHSGGPASDNTRTDSTGPDNISPDSTGPDSTGPDTTGPDTAGSVTSGSDNLASEASGHSLTDADPSDSGSPAPDGTIPNILSDYLLPQSSTVRLTMDDIAAFSPDELKLARNEIYARHGRAFQSQELQSYFDGKSWYHRQVDANAFSDSVLNEVERDNIRLLQSAEPVKGLPELAYAPDRQVLHQYGYYYGHSDLSFLLQSQSAKDCGDYYQVDAVYLAKITVPSSLKPGDTITPVFNELTGETRTLVYAEGGLCIKEGTEPLNPVYYYNPSDDGGPVTLYEGSEDRVEKPVYEGTLLIRRDATIEQASANQTETVTLDQLQNNFGYYNAVYFDQKGYVTRLTWFGD